MGIFGLFGKPTPAGEWFGKSASEKDSIVENVTRDYLTATMDNLRKLNDKSGGTANILAKEEATSAIEQRIVTMYKCGEVQSLVDYVSGTYKRTRANTPYLNLVLRAIDAYFKEIERMKLRGEWPSVRPIVVQMPRRLP